MTTTAPRPRPSVPASEPDLVSFGSAERLGQSLSGMAQGLRPSMILRIAAEVRRVAATRPVCDLTVGDFDPRQFPIPPELLDAVHQALDQGETNYPPSDGMPALRRAVAERVARDDGVRYPVESVLIAAGVRPLLYAACRAVLDPGDVVVYGVPSWNTDHYAWLTQARGVPLATGAESRFHPTAEALAPWLGQARLICLCSPGNPTGTMIATPELERIARAVVEENARRERTGAKGLFLLYDQVYGSLVHAGHPHAHPVACVPEAAPWTIVLDGISKAFAATGLRVGWALAAPLVTAKMSDLMGHLGAWAPRAEQVATARFLGDDHAVRRFRANMAAALRVRLEALGRGFGELRTGGYPVDFVQPEGAIYLALRLALVGRRVNGRAMESNEDIRRVLLEAAGFAAVPFQAFGLPEDSGWFRLSVGAVSPETIAEVFPRIRALLDRLD